LDAKLGHNGIKEIRERFLISKAELSRKSGVSISTINRFEKVENCRAEIKRKIILALGYDLSDRDRIFPDDQQCLKPG
jgi:DNA-binding XRE family transcriptional regulator